MTNFFVVLRPFLVKLRSEKGQKGALDTKKEEELDSDLLLASKKVKRGRTEVRIPHLDRTSGEGKVSNIRI